MSLKLISTEGMQRRPCPLATDADTADMVEGLFIQQGATGFDVADGSVANVYQIWTGKRTWWSDDNLEVSSPSQRTDVEAIVRTVDDETTATGKAMVSGQVTGLFGEYIAETDQFVGTPAVNAALTVNSDGKLEAIEAEDEDSLTFAYVDAALADSSHDGMLRFRRVL